MITAELARWRPFVHDSLIYFFHELGTEEVMERFLKQLQISGDVDRDGRVLELAAGTPILQTIGQILARKPAIPRECLVSWQQLQNSFLMTDSETLSAMIWADLGKDRIAAYQLELASELLDEASVGSVIAGSLTLPGEQMPAGLYVR